MGIRSEKEQVCVADLREIPLWRLNFGTDYFSKTRYNFNALGRVAQLVRALP